MVPNKNDSDESPDEEFKTMVLYVFKEMRENINKLLNEIQENRNTWMKLKINAWYENIIQ